MIQIRAIDHVVLRVVDLPRMQDFYCGVLGCTLARAEPAQGLYQLRAGSALIDLVTVTGPLGRKGGAAPALTGRNVDHVCLRIDPFDAEAILAYLRARGCTPGPVARRHGAEGFGPSIYVEDPEGNTIELKGPPESASPAVPPLHGSG